MLCGVVIAKSIVSKTSTTDNLYGVFVVSFNSSRPGQNGRHITDNIFICILVNEMFCISIKISLMFASKSSIDNNPALV